MPFPLLGRLLVLPVAASLALCVPTAAGATDTEPAVVANGTFSSPLVPDGSTFAAGIEGWSGKSYLASAARSGHPQGFQGAALNYGGERLSISTRVRGVAAGATVTLSWDDNPDTCVAAGGPGRTYAVTVAGQENAGGAFTTKAPNKSPNWYIGRVYSFTAAEDAPQITFTSTDATPACGFLISNVQATQTRPRPIPPQPTPPAPSDPCAGQGASTPACTTDAGNKEKIDNCPATDRTCLSGVAGKGEKEKAGIENQTQALDGFTNTPREQDPNAAAADLCKVSGALTDNLQPGDTVIAPGTWWYC